MLLQIEFSDLYILTPILSIIILIVLMVVMVELYVKIRRFPLILVVFLFSLVIGMSSLSEGNIPFTPYFQIFFMLFQSIIFLLTSIDVYNEVKGN